MGFYGIAIVLGYFVLFSEEYRSPIVPVVFIGVKRHDQKPAVPGTIILDI